MQVKTKQQVALGVPRTVWPLSEPPPCSEAPPTTPSITILVSSSLSREKSGLPVLQEQLVPEVPL